VSSNHTIEFIHNALAKKCLPQDTAGFGLCVVHLDEVLDDSAPRTLPLLSPSRARCRKLYQECSGTPTEPRTYIAREIHTELTSSVSQWPPTRCSSSQLASRAVASQRERVRTVRHGQVARTPSQVCVQAAAAARSQVSSTQCTSVCCALARSLSLTYWCTNSPLTCRSCIQACLAATTASSRCWEREDSGKCGTYARPVPICRTP